MTIDPLKQLTTSGECKCFSVDLGVTSVLIYTNRPELPGRKFFTK